MRSMARTKPSTELKCATENVPNELVVDLDGLEIGTSIKISSISLSLKSFVKLKIENNVNVGPYARLRPGTVLKSGSKVGNFVEVKKSIIGKDSKLNHLSYIGDSKLGRKVNIGAGTITCNYDGIKKSKTKIKDKVFIGSHFLKLTFCTQILSCITSVS